jgi:hypothetical protein
MATSQTTGRNRGARKGSEEATNVLNIGAGLTAKPDQTSIKLTAQDARPDGRPTETALEAVKLERKTLDAAAKIIGGFHKANDELQSLKDDIEKKRGGLSDICFQLAKLGASAADKPEHRLAACYKVFDSAEAYERQRYQKANKLADLPTSREALGSSWQTYKSQILKCVRAGLNPEDFANGTVYREAMSLTGNQARGRGARTTAGAVAGAATVAGVLESATMRTELSAAVADLVKNLQALPEDKQLDFAERVRRISVAAHKEALKTAGAGEQTEEMRDTATMQ